MSRSEEARAATGTDASARVNYFNYFTEIEDAFIRRRGKHLLLSPMDWALIESWKTMGVPLHVALRGIEKSFDSHASRPRKRSVKSLMYCQEEVEAQFHEWLESQSGAHAPSASSGAVETNGSGDGERKGETASLPFPREVIAAHLAECLASLRRARDERRARAGEDELAEALERACLRLEELKENFAEAARPDAEKLEASLTDLEGLLDRALRASLPAEVVESNRAHAAEQLSSYRKRMERAVYEQTLENLLAKLLREACSIPRLSLFYI